MSREEKRHRFNEAVVNTLYPPPLPKDEDLEVKNYNAGFDAPIPDDFVGTSSSTSGDDDNDDDDCGESEPGKLTRAKRKRLRRKKLKSDSSSSVRKIIGPLLPSTEIGSNKADPPTVRRNASENKPDECALRSVEPRASVNKNKVKQRRKVKKLARENSLASKSENFDCDHGVDFESCDKERHGEN